MSLLSSIDSTIGATVALESLNSTTAQSQSTEKQISTGFRVNDATDNGAAYAVAQRVRSDVGALTTANQQLGASTGLVSTTLSSLNQVSTTANAARQVLVTLADGDITGTQRTQYIAQYQSDVANIKSDLRDASYSGKTLVGNITGSSGTFGSVNVVRNELGATYNIANQVSYNNDKIDALNTGLGSLVDANLAQESALLQSLQLKQQLGTQALSIANQAPQSLLSLFK